MKVSVFFFSGFGLYFPCVPPLPVTVKLELLKKIVCSDYVRFLFSMVLLRKNGRELYTTHRKKSDIR